MDHRTSLPPESTLERPVLGSWHLRRRGTTVDHLPDELRHIRVDMLRWALRNGRWVDAAALTALLSAKLELDGPFMRWTSDDVCDLLEAEVDAWCESVGAAVPESLPATLWAVLDYLALVGFARGSEPLATLHAPLLAHGLTRNGRPRRAAVSNRSPTARAAHAAGVRRHPSAPPPD
jgi:hypothetical protein